MDNFKLINNILKHIDKIVEYTKDVNYDEFAKDVKLQDACLLNLTQIGENVVGLDDEFLNNHQEIKWKEMKGMRNLIVHDYDGVNMKIVWDTISGDLPNLRDVLSKLMK